jgi:hypothetical protein
MKIRRIISLTVFLAFIFLALSGIALFLSPQGRVAYWAGWTFFGLTKDHYSAIHTTFMVLFLVTGIWHIVLNWRPIVGYLKNRSKELRIVTPESTVALVLALLFLVGPLTGLPPFQQFLDAGEEIKAYWESTRGSPPWGHAEESRLDAFCRRITDFQRWEGEGVMMVDCEEAQAALEAAGIRVESQEQRILEIARANGVTPQEVADVVLGAARPATPEEIAAGLAGSRGRGLRGAPGGGGGSSGEAGTGVGTGAGPGAGAQVPSPEEAGGTEVEEPMGHQEKVVRFPRPGSGLGRMTLRRYAREYGFDVGELVGILEDQGMAVDPGARFSEAAARLGVPPAEIIDALNRGG